MLPRYFTGLVAVAVTTGSLFTASTTIASNSLAAATVNSQARAASEQPAAVDLELPPLGGSSDFLPQRAQEMRLVLRIRERRVYLYSGAERVVSYPVAVGKPGWETPTGSFAITHKVVNPAWQNPFTGAVIPPGSANPLGDRLIVFAQIKNGHVGFHGTPNESLIGQAVSHGCVRMRNNDIRALFEKVQVGTPVIVQP